MMTPFSQYPGSAPVLCITFLQMLGSLLAFFHLCLHCFHTFFRPIPK